MSILNFTADSTSRYGSPPAEDHVFARVPRAMSALTAVVGGWLKRRHTRQVLANLDDHQLRDIGLTRAELSKF